MIMTNLEYRNAPGVSRSELWQFSKTPMHYRHYISTEEKPTPSLIFGSAQHKYVLERDDFEKEYAVLPGDIDRRTKAGKEAYAEFLNLANGRTIITEDQYVQILDMYEALKQNELAIKYLGGLHEQSYFWEDAETGIQCKIRPDVVTTIDGKPYLVDYKTTDSCEYWAFNRSCYKYGYNLQAGMYVAGMFQNVPEDYGFAFVAQEKTEPYLSRVFICSDDFIRSGYDKFREYLGTLKYCTETGDWYGYEGPAHEATLLGGEDDD